MLKDKKRIERQKMQSQAQIWSLRASLTISISILAFVLIGTMTVLAQVGAAVDIYAQLATVNDALNGVHEAIQHADHATQDRLADADSRVYRAMKELDDLISRHEKKGEAIAQAILDKAFHNANDTLFNVSLLVQDAGVDYQMGVNNAVLNAARVLSGIPFVHIQPFVAMVYPLNLVPGTQDDYHIELLGFFRPEWGDHVLILPDGKKIVASLGANNRLGFTITRELVRSYSGKRFTVKLRYPVEHNWVLPNTTSDRELWFHVLPPVMLDYRIVATALPPTQYDYPVVAVDANEEAGAGDSHDRDVVWGFQDLTGQYDFVNAYDKSLSSIDSAVIKPGDARGNNPTGDNRAALIESAGQRILLRLHVHGKPQMGFSGGAGANSYAKVTVTLKLARKNSPVSWHFQNNQKDVGSLKWGDDQELFPTDNISLASAIVDLTDYSFDPPQHRTLALGESYYSRFVSAVTTPQRLSLMVRSFEMH